MLLALFSPSTEPVSIFIGLLIFSFIIFILIALVTGELNGLQLIGNLYFFMISILRT